jgi:uncharacterized membrane protein YhaH (DUF805 family)
MEWMLMPIRRYADFEGRSRRMEYWMFYLGQLILYTVLAVFFVFVSVALGSAGAEMAALIILIPFFLLMLALFIPTLAVTVRRLHDQDKSGWWILIQLIPFGGLVLLVFMVLDGTPGPNQYGPDPKGKGDAQTFA